MSPMPRYYFNVYNDDVTMDDEGTEYEGGWILVEDGLVKDAGAG